MPPKKVPFTPFKARSRCRSLEPVATVDENQQANGEFRDSEVTFSPIMPKADVSLTITFRCTCVLVRGDIITVRLAGFKGAQATLFCLEPRSHPEEVDYRRYFHAYWSGEAPPKGGPPAQSIVLQVRQEIKQNALVIVGVPDTVRISLPDKLGANSAKLKIEGIVKHSNGPGPMGKIPKAPISACPEVKKKPIDEDLAELEKQLKLITEVPPPATPGEDEVQYALEMTQQEVDHIWEAARDVSELKIPMVYRHEVTAWTEYKPYAPLIEMLVENYKAASKKFHPLALHREIAANLGVSVGKIVMLEDVLYMLHGSQYCELARSAVLVLRLWTMEPVDLNRVLTIDNAQSIQREILSGLRSFNKETLAKWSLFMGTLMTTPSRLISVPQELLPSMFRGVRDLPHEAIQHILTLKRESIYCFPTFVNYSTEAKFTEESYIAPDNAVVFEVQGAVEGIEISDVSQYPESKEWMLPFFTSFTVISVQQLVEKNNLIHVVLRYNGALIGNLREESFPDTDKSLMSAVVKNVRANSGQLGMHSHTVARLVYANLRLNDLKAVHPTHAVQRQYLDKFADVKRHSQAKQQTESGQVRWLISAETVVAGAEPVPTRQIAWNPLKGQPAVTLETLFLKRTRAVKQLQADGISVDFKEWTADLGKGQRHIARQVDKQFTHPFVQ